MIALYIIIYVILYVLTCKINKYIMIKKFGYIWEQSDTRYNLFVSLLVVLPSLLLLILVTTDDDD